jgi:hypothetical protein
LLRHLLMEYLTVKDCCTIKCTSHRSQFLINVDFVSVVKREYLRVHELLMDATMDRRSKSRDVEEFIWNYCRRTESLKYVWEQYHDAYIHHRGCFQPYLSIYEKKLGGFDFHIAGIKTKDFNLPSLRCDSSNYNYFRWVLVSGCLENFSRYLKGKE